MKIPDKPISKGKKNLKKYYYCVNCISLIWWIISLIFSVFIFVISNNENNQLCWFIVFPLSILLVIFFEFFPKNKGCLDKLAKIIILLFPLLLILFLVLHSIMIITKTNIEPSLQKNNMSEIFYGSIIYYFILFIAMTPVVNFLKIIKTIRKIKNSRNNNLEQ